MWCLIVLIPVLCTLSYFYLSPPCLVMSDRARVLVTDMADDKSFEAASQTMVEYETLMLQKSPLPGPALSSKVSIPGD